MLKKKNLTKKGVAAVVDALNPTKQCTCTFAVGDQKRHRTEELFAVFFI
jgi:hypothetical protein